MPTHFVPSDQWIDWVKVVLSRSVEMTCLFGVQVIAVVGTARLGGFVVWVVAAVVVAVEKWYALCEYQETPRHFPCLIQGYLAED